MPDAPSITDLDLSLDQALALIDRHLGSRAMLDDTGADRVAIYYRQSRPAYDRVHSGEGCMHVALNPDGRFDRDGFLYQPRAVSQVIASTGARRVLELGTGLGFNSRWLAARHPDVQFVALDLLPDHVAETRRRAAAQGLGNLTVVQGSFDDLPADLGAFDTVFAIETLCYTADPVRVAAGVARHLAPGGRFLAFEPLSLRPLQDLPAPMALATQLYWLGVAVTRPVPGIGDWQAALAAGGLQPDPPQDLTVQAAPGLRVFADRALSSLAQRKWQLLMPMLPRYLKRNLATALAGPFVCFGDPLRLETGRGSVGYIRLGAQAPRGPASA